MLSKVDIAGIQIGRLVPIARGERGGRTAWSCVICRVDDGIPDRVGRTAACGNAVVPQIPEMIGHAILKTMRAA